MKATSHYCNGRGFIDRNPRHDLCDTRVYRLDAYGNVGAKGSCKCPCHDRRDDVTKPDTTYSFPPATLIW